MLKGSRRVCYLGSIVARPKLKGIGGETLQRVTRAVQLDYTPWTSPGATAGWRSVWRAYLTRWEELHGRRQPVPWGDLLNQVTGKTHMYIYYVYNIQIALETRMKVWATLGLYSPNPLGNTRASMVDTTGCDTERWSQSLKVHLSLDRSLQLNFVTLEFVVIVCYQRTVNMSLSLALTARQINRV